MTGSDLFLSGSTIIRRGHHLPDDIIAYPSFGFFAVHSKSWEAGAGVYSSVALITKFRTPNQKEFTDFL